MHLPDIANAFGQFTYAYNPQELVEILRHSLKLTELQVSLKKEKSSKKQLLYIDIGMTIFKKVK